MNPPFELKRPAISGASEIEESSLSLIAQECERHPRFARFSPAQREVAVRLIHTTTCFDQVMASLFFTQGATRRITEFLKEGAVIIADTTMIRSGLSSRYTELYGNRVVCRVGEEEVRREAEEAKSTRSCMAVQKALREEREKPVILACGNAPTFLYCAIQTLVEEGFDPARIAFLAFPVGFVNVTESKEYVMEYMNAFGCEGIVMEGRFGSSPMVVSALHALYRLIPERKESLHASP